VNGVGETTQAPGAMAGSGVMETRLRHLRLNLLRQKGWRYLRYFHLRDFISGVQTEIRTVGVSGAGLGFAEMAIAIEFPHIEFMLTDVVLPGRPNYWKAMDMCMRWHIRNVRFGVWDLLAPPPCRFDAVVSTEVLEHIKTPEIAIRNQLLATRKVFYALAPFATSVANNSVEKRMTAYLQHEHFVCGYDSEFFAAQIDGVATYGAYWHGQGGKFRQKLQGLSAEDAETQFDELVQEAGNDIQLREPSQGACMAIKAVARV